MIQRYTAAQVVGFKKQDEDHGAAHLPELIDLSCVDRKLSFGCLAVIGTGLIGNELFFLPTEWSKVQKMERIVKCRLALGSVARGGYLPPIWNHLS